MNVQSDLRMDKGAFLGWVEGRPERYELSKSRVVMMTGGSRGHALVTRRLAAALERRLDARRFAVLTSDFGVDLGPDTVRYPDVVVDVAGRPLKDVTATAPVLIAEVTSLSSATYDLGDKAAEYLQLASLQAYVVLAQDQPKSWLWARTQSGFPAGPAVGAGMETVVAIPALDIELPLSEIFAELGPQP